MKNANEAGNGRHAISFEVPRDLTHLTQSTYTVRAIRKLRYSTYKLLIVLLSVSIFFYLRANKATKSQWAKLINIFL